MKRRVSVQPLVGKFRPSTPSFIALTYAAAGFLWIGISDALAVRLVGLETAQALQTVKGLVFIAATALAIYILLRRRRLISTQDLASLELVSAAHAALEQSEMRLRQVVDASLDAVITVSSDDLVLDWNEEAERLFGWTRAEAIGEKLSDLIIPPADHARYNEALTRVAGNRIPMAGEARRFEENMLDRTGSEFPAEVTVAPVAWGDRVVMTLFVRDISSRVRAAEEAQLIQAVVNAAPFAIVGLDERGEILSWNPAAEEMYGWRASEVRGGTAGILFPHDSGDLPSLLDRVRLAAHVEGVQAMHARSDGKLIAVVWTLAPLPPVSGVRRSALITADLSERQLLERRLSDAEYLASLGRLAGTVAHEFNNVLMGIQSFAEVIGRQATANDPIDRAVGQIRFGIQRGRGITEDILRFTRAAVAPTLSAINIDKWLPEIAEDIRELVAPNVAVDIVPASRGLHVIGDHGQLYQVITNLALNAKDAMPAGGTITISAAPCPPPPGAHSRDDCVEISITDTGAGMDPETAALAFEPLFTTKRRGGTGLGLTVVQKIVRAHGGEVKLQTAPGKGTTFRIQLPARYQEVPRPAPAIESRSFRPRRILLIEDDVAIAAGLADVLRSYDMTVDVLHTGVHAVEAVEQFRPDVVVLDVGLPERDGVEVYADIARAHPQLPVVFSTGHADEARLDGPLSHPNVRFLRKPYAIEMLLTEIEQLTAG